MKFIMIGDYHLVILVSCKIQSTAIRRFWEDLMRKKLFTEWLGNSILFLCVLEKKGDVVKLTVVTLKTLFITLSCYRFPLGIMISIN